MPHERKAGYVRAGVDAVVHNAVPRVFIERGHEPDDRIQRGFVYHLRLVRRGQNADAERLGQKQHVPWPCAEVLEHLVGMHKPRNGKAVLRLLVENAVAAGDDCARFVNLVVPAREDGAHGLGRHAFRHAEQVERELGLAAHGVNVRERVGGSDLPEGERIVHDGRKEVHRLHEGECIAHAVDGSVVRAVKANEQVGVGARRQIA
ncbi:hypothetical protein SDC9_93551 [bioreactor metagenome]|uniref:Uncharacterized protein n=1 Tax=bioreactor metagenome TaxID=1076179 RepID=A0A645AAY2_9ZZZZ